jgi:UDP-N-acetylmuramate dehydrogenase
MTHPPVPLRKQEPMERHTSWRAGGIAEYYAEPASIPEVAALVAWAHERDLPLVWAGRGTNTLVRDTGFPGLVIAYRAQGWELSEQGDTALLRAEAGAPMAGLARRLSALGWAGLEWAEGLPGTVGGAIFGNAGCYGGDVAGSLASAELLVGETVELWPVARLDYGYRTSALKQLGTRGRGHAGRSVGADRLLPDGERGEPSPTPLILAGAFKLTRDDPAALAVRTAAIAAARKSKTPSGSSCGSVFKNPPGDSAGRLIEAAGLKGQRVGAAVISPLHANYIVNSGGATASEILKLAATAQAAVRDRFGIELELEVRVIP